MSCIKFIKGKSLAITTMERYLISQGFFGFNLLFMLIFAVITLLVSIFAYRIYKLTKQNQLRLFSIAFLSFSISYILRAAVNFIPRHLSCIEDAGPCQGLGPLGRTPIFPSITENIHVVFFMLGLVLLVYMVLKIEDKRILMLLAGAVSISLLFTPRHLLVFHLTSFFLLWFIVVEYYKNYKRHKQSQPFIVLAAFVILLLGQLSLIFSVFNPFFFMAGRVAELLCYLLILTNLLLTLKK